MALSSNDWHGFVHFRLSDEGNVLGTRNDGVRASQKLRTLYAGQPAIVLDFRGVEAATIPYLSQLVSGLFEIVLEARDASRPVVAVANVDDDVIPELEAVLERRHAMIALLTSDGVELLSGAPHLEETLRAAQKLPSTFTTTQLAERLSINVTSANERLRSLVDSGVLARERDPHATRGKRFLYRMPDPELIRAVGS
jgi:hypothetical protein